MPMGIEHVNSIRMKWEERKKLWPKIANTLRPNIEYQMATVSKHFINRSVVCYFSKYLYNLLRITSYELRYSYTFRWRTTFCFANLWVSIKSEQCVCSVWTHELAVKTPRKVNYYVLWLQLKVENFKNNFFYSIIRRSRSQSQKPTIHCPVWHVNCFRILMARKKKYEELNAQFTDYGAQYGI